jgi:hypothetical protein
MSATGEARYVTILITEYLTCPKPRDVAKPNPYAKLIYTQDQALGYHKSLCGIQPLPGSQGVVSQSGIVGPLTASLLGSFCRQRLGSQ